MTNLITNLIVSASVSSFFFGLFGVNWESVDEKIEREFPGVEFVSSDTLIRQYGESGQTPVEDSRLPIIIDVREAEEFRVSHLQYALNLKTGQSVAQVITDKDTAIIVYCSVGYRSAGVAAELESLGYTRVLNLRHSIFEWASKDYPMINQTGDTDKVHPFSRAWGALVEQSLHSYSP